MVEQWKHMKYLEACLCDGSRCHLPRVKSLAALLGAMYEWLIPYAIQDFRGQSWVIHQNSQIFGEGVKHFRPENELGKSKDETGKPAHYVR